MANYREGFDLCLPQYPNSYIEVIRVQKSNGNWSDNILFNVYLQNMCIPPDAMLLLETLDGVKKHPYLPCKFNSDDFYQNTFQSIHPGLKLGHEIHECILATKQQYPFDIKNVYSTNSEIDSQRHPALVISPLALRFWENRKALDKAEYSSFCGRYRIKF